MLPLVVAVPSHHDQVDVGQEVVERQLVIRVQAGARHRFDPPIAAAIVRNVAIETHCEPQTDRAR